MIEMVSGNLLDSDVEALVNTVNTVGVMGKGVALQFKKAFPANYKAYRYEADHGRLALGKLFVYDAGAFVRPRYIINFPTKQHWKGSSKLEYIDSGLKALVATIRERGITSIAIPPLGCGSGGLSWEDVAPRIERAFSALPGVHVQLFVPAGAPVAAAMKNRTDPPRLTVGRAAILELMNRYLVPGYSYLLSLLEVQKLAYFLQEAGQPLKLQFEKAHYGPYADNLRHVLDRLEGHFIEGFGDGQNKPDTPVALKAGASAAAASILMNEPDLRRRLERVTTLIEGFETPYGMELLSSVHWVAHSENAVDNAEAAVSAVHAWNARKATLKSEHIREAWERLQSTGWV